MKKFVEIQVKFTIYKLGCQKIEILGFSYFQVNGVLKCTCQLPTFSYYNQNVSKF